MKKTAKLLTALLAMLLLFSAIPVFGAGLPDPTGSLTIHKYIMADLDYAALPNDGNEAGAANGNPELPLSAVAKDGILFDAYLLTGIIYRDGSGEHTLPIRDNQNGNTNNTGNVITTPLGNEAMYAILDDFDKFTFSLNNYDAPTQIDLLTGFEVKDDNYLGGVRTIIGFELGTVAGTSKFAFPATGFGSFAPGVTKVDNMPKGFYLVREQITGSNPDDVASVVFPFIVAVPMTNADGDGWIQDVHVYPKNGDISIHKYIDRNAVHLGEKVMMDVVVSIPADIRTYGQFDMTDVLDACLTYVPGSLKVYGYKGVNVDPDPVNSLITGDTPALGWELFASSVTADGLTGTIWIQAGVGVAPPNVELPYFTVTEPVITGTNTLTVVANKQQRPSPVTSRGQTIEFWKLREYNFIRYQFEVIVNAALLDHNTTNHPSYVFDNEAKITFKNKFDTQVGRDRNRTSNKVRAHSAAILMDKIDANNNNVLEGAEFKIASSEANARAGNFLRQIKVGSTVLGILDVGQSVTIGGTTYTYAGLTAAADWVEVAKIPADPADAGLYPDIWNYVKGKAVVRFEGLKEFGTTHTNGIGRKDYADTPTNKVGIQGDLEDQAKNSRLDNSSSYSKGLPPDGGPSNKYLSYWIVETKTPTGYNLLLEPIKVTFSRTYSQYDNWYTIGSSAADAIRIRNSNKFTLPKTGGIGTILFTAGGAALICVAVFLFLASRKKKKEQAN